MHIYALCHIQDNFWRKVVDIIPKLCLFCICIMCPYMHTESHTAPQEAFMIFLAQ